MKVLVKRAAANSNETVGILSIDGVPLVCTCEDEGRNVKIAGETRIWAGTYKLGLRTVGGHHERYTKMFPNLHKGMLELQDVPQFKYILIHIGNTEKDTDGCILVGEKIFIAGNGKMSVENSTLAYQRIYKKIIDELIAGKEVWITIQDV
jgi:hypothetical protein